MNFFDTDAEKGVPNRKTRFPQKKNKMEAMVHQNLRLEKSVKKVEKSNFIQKRHAVPSSATLFMEDSFVRKLDSRFFNPFD